MFCTIIEFPLHLPLLIYYHFFNLLMADNGPVFSDKTVSIYNM